EPQGRRQGRGPAARRLDPDADRDEVGPVRGRVDDAGADAARDVARGGARPRAEPGDPVGDGGQVSERRTQSARANARGRGRFEVRRLLGGVALVAPGRRVRRGWVATLAMAGFATNAAADTAKAPPAASARVRAVMTNTDEVRACLALPGG